MNADSRTGLGRVTKETSIWSVSFYIFHFKVSKAKMTFVDLEWIVFYKGKVPDSTCSKCAEVAFIGETHGERINSSSRGTAAPHLCIAHHPLWPWKAGEGAGEGFFGCGGFEGHDSWNSGPSLMWSKTRTLLRCDMPNIGSRPIPSNQVHGQG